MKTWKRGKNHGEIDQNHGKQMKTFRRGAVELSLLQSKLIKI